MNSYDRQYRANWKQASNMKCLRANLIFMLNLSQFYFDARTFRYFPQCMHKQTQWQRKVGNSHREHMESSSPFVYLETAASKLSFWRANLPRPSHRIIVVRSPSLTVSFPTRSDRVVIFMHPPCGGESSREFSRIGRCVRWDETRHRVSIG